MNVSEIYEKFVETFEIYQKLLVEQTENFTHNYKLHLESIDLDKLNFDKKTLYQHSLLIGSALCVILTLILIISWLCCSSKRSGNISFEACKSPDCVRCAKFKDILEVSYKRFQQYLKNKGVSLTSTDGLSYKRILNSFEDIGFMVKKQAEDKIHRRKALQYQKPTVFTLVDVTSRPFWDDVYLMDMLVLEQNFDAISREFEKAFNLHDCEEMQYWTRNTTPRGTWSVFSLINQGTPIERNLEICPNTWSVVKSLSSLMKDCVFENVVFSVVFPDTVITEHYGPTNTRVRCHLGLQIPDGCNLTVNGLTRSWKAGRCIIFDDSYIHSVQYKPTVKKSNQRVTGDGANEVHPVDKSKLRVVLMVDLWHPWLTERERAALSYSFSTMGVCSQSGK